MSVSFFTLPVGVFQDPILSFLTPLCLSKLDRAVANRLLRKELLEYFAHAVVRNRKEDHVFRFDPCSLRWALDRHLHFTNVSVARSGMDEYCDELSSVISKASHVDCGFGALCGDDVVQILQNCEKLRSSTVSYNEGMTDSVLSAITTQHPRLKVLNMESCEDMTDHALTAIARNCTSLVRLDIGSNDGLDANQLATMLCQMPNLRWLNVTTAMFLSHQWRMIFDHCSLLQYINVSFTMLDAETILYMGQKCPLITSFTMHGEADDLKIAALAYALPHLQEVDLLDCCELTALGISYLAKTCKDLCKIVLCDCPDVTDECFATIALNCPQLTILDCSMSGRTTTDISIVLLAQGCTKLEMLKLPFSDAMTDASLVALAHNCPRLQHVSVENGHSITDAGIIALSTHCLHLKYLVLGYNKLTDAVLVGLATHLPGLWELKLQECKKFTSAGIVALAQQCKSLAYLKIDRCKKVDDAGVIAVVQNCRRLRTLELHGLPGVTNDFADVCISMRVRAEMKINSTDVTVEKLVLLQQLRM